MIIHANCAWCRAINTIDDSMIDDTLDVFCWNCRHRADLPRGNCDCYACRNIYGPGLEATIDLADVVRIEVYLDELENMIRQARH